MQELNLTSEELCGLLEKTLGQGCRMKLKCPGHSMSPLIRHNSLLTLRPTGPEADPELGDIVAAVCRKRQIIIHRIVGRRRGQYLLKGDNNKDCDGWFHSPRILGIVEIVKDENGQCRGWALHFKYLAAFASRTNLLKLILVPVLGMLRKNCKIKLLHKFNASGSPVFPW